MLYGCETWSLTLREESKLRVFENRILRRVFGSKVNENEEWRRLHNFEIHSLYCPPNIFRVIRSRRLRWAGHISGMGDGRNAFNILTGKHTGKGPSGKLRRRGEDNIRMELKGIGTNTKNSFDSDHDWNYRSALVYAT